MPLRFREKVQEVLRRQGISRFAAPYAAYRLA